MAYLPCRTCDKVFDAGSSFKLDCPDCVIRNKAIRAERSQHKRKRYLTVQNVTNWEKVRICPTCQKSFIVKPVGTAGFSRTFCSNDCRIHAPASVASREFLFAKKAKGVRLEKGGNYADEENGEERISEDGKARDEARDEA